MRKIDQKALYDSWDREDTLKSQLRTYTCFAMDIKTDILKLLDSDLPLNVLKAKIKEIINS